MASSNPNGPTPATVDQRRLQLCSVDSPLSPPMVDANAENMMDITYLTEISTGEKRKREGRLRSIVWDHFTKLIKDDGTCDKCQCHHCHKIFTCLTRSGTTHLLRHITEGICPVYNKEKKDNSPTSVSYMRGSIERKRGTNPWKFDQALDQGSAQQSIDTHDNLLPTSLDDFERQTCATPEGDHYTGQTSMPVFPKLSVQPLKSQPIADADLWMIELKACVGKLVELASEIVSKESSDKTRVAPSPPDFSIASAVKCLNEMEDIPQSSVMYVDAFDIIRDPEERECFICLNPEPRRRWLQRMLHRRYPLRYDNDV